MIKKLYDKCIVWAGYKYAKQILAIEAFIESSFFPIPPDVMIIPMVISKKNEFIRIALIATIFSVLGALFGYYIGYSLNEIAIKIFEFYGYEYSSAFKEKFSSLTNSKENMECVHKDIICKVHDSIYIQLHRQILKPKK